MRYSQQGVMKDTRPWTKFFVAGAAAVTLSIALFASAFAVTTTVLYDSTPTPTPPNVASLGFEATATSEFGDRVTLTGAGKKLDRAEVTMSTWATQAEYTGNSAYSSPDGWTHPITVNVYNVQADGSVGSLIDSQERSIQIPWRPAADSTCPNTGYGEGFAWRASDGDCYNGKAFTAGFTFDTPQNLPQDVIVAVAYDTQSYGSPALGVPGPYNSLNVAIPEDQTVNVGSDNNNDNVYWSSTYDGRELGLRVDSGWSPNGTVAFKLISNLETGALTKEMCKNNGWITLSVDGKSFKNQGQCVAYVQSSDNSKHRR